MKQLLSGNVTFATANANALKTYAHGRVGLFTNSVNGATTMKLDNPIVGLINLERQINAGLIGMEKAVHIAILGLMTGDNVFFLSRPGLAKSTLASMIARGLSGKFYRKNFSPDMTQNDLFGAISVKKMSEGLYEREWAGLATAEYALLDEFFKGSKTLQADVLEVCEEHKLFTVNGEKELPLLGIIAASNELVDANCNSAIWDRFAYRYEVPGINDGDSLMSMMKADGINAPVTACIDPEELLLLQGYIECQAKHLPEEVLEKVASIYMGLKRSNIELSPRRFLMFGRAIYAEYILSLYKALLAGNKPTKEEKKVMMDDALLVGEDILWIDVNDREIVRNIVTENSSEERMMLIEIKSALNLIRTNIDTGKYSFNTSGIHEVSSALNNIKTRIIAPLQEMLDANPKNRCEIEDLLESAKTVNADLIATLN